MVQTAVTQVIKTLNDVHQRFGLRRSQNEQFFTEWYADLPSLDASERSTLDRVRQRFRYHREAGQVAGRTVLESKETEFDVEVGIPQTLAYMMANPALDAPLYGMVTNGNSFIFIKVKPGEIPEYDFSETYTLLSRSNRLYDVLQILKSIAQSMVR